MARFYGSIKGNRGGAVTRLGTTRSGLHAKLNGWEFGIRVALVPDPETGKDMAEVWVTTGSNGRGPERLVGCYYQDALTPKGD